MPSKDPEVRRAQWRAWYQRNKEKRAEYLREYRNENADQIRAKAAEWEAANAELRRETYQAWFEKNAEQKRKGDRERRAAIPHAERLRQQREWAEKNPDKVLEYNQQRRARIAGAPVVERVDRGAIYERDSGRCHICETYVPRASFTLDHLVPLSRGGEHASRNLRVAHRSCNSRRGAGRLPAQLLLIG